MIYITDEKDTKLTHFESLTTETTLRYLCGPNLFKQLYRSVSGCDSVENQHNIGRLNNVKGHKIIFRRVVKPVIGLAVLVILLGPLQLNTLL